MLPTTPTPGPAEVYAALWVGRSWSRPASSLPAIDELAVAYFERYSPDAKA